MKLLSFKELKVGDTFKFLSLFTALEALGYEEDSPIFVKTGENQIAFITRSPSHLQEQRVLKQEKL